MRSNGAGRRFDNCEGVARACVSTCALVAGDVGEQERLVARSPDEHRRNGIDLRMRTEVEKIDLAAGRVLAHDLATGRSCWEGFDSLVIATGAFAGTAAVTAALVYGLLEVVGSLLLALVWARRQAASGVSPGVAAPVPETLAK